MQKISVTVRIDKMLIDALDRQVDGVKFSSRTHAIAVLLTEYLERYSKENRGIQTSFNDLKPQKKHKPGT